MYTSYSPLMEEIRDETSYDLNSLEPILEFRYTPMKLKKKLDRHIIGQEAAKRAVSVGICSHYTQLSHLLGQSMEHRDRREYLFADMTKQNIMIIGPSGCGKTLTFQALKKILDIPLVISDATKYSETGYVGKSVEEIPRDLNIASGRNLLLAVSGMVYIDEFDKLSKDGGKKTRNNSVQEALLQMSEYSTLDLGSYPFPTNKVLFAIGGAFEGLEGIVKNRPGNENLDGNWANSITNEDLVEYGIERQILGRFPIRAVFDPLDKKNMIGVLKYASGSPIKYYKKLLDLWGIELRVSDGAIDVIADYSCSENVGARGINAVLSGVLEDTLFELPDSDTKKFVLTKKYALDKLKKKGGD